jgi:hypothetical protein
MQMKQFWMAVAVICIAGAAVALWLEHFDAGFAIATVGALAWFLSYRVSAKQLVKEANKQANEDEESSESIE